MANYWTKDEKYKPKKASAKKTGTKSAAVPTVKAGSAAANLPKHMRGGKIHTPAKPKTRTRKRK